MISRKKGVCKGGNRYAGCGKEDVWIGSKSFNLCVYCNSKRLSEQKKKPKRIRKVSLKMQKVLTEKYYPLRMKFLKENPSCQAKLEGCTRKSTDVHHKKGRGKYLLDVSTWLSSCRNCHNYIEIHPKEALLLGLSEKRL